MMEFLMMQFLFVAIVSSVLAFILGWIASIWSVRFETDDDDRSEPPRPPPPPPNQDDRPPLLWLNGSEAITLEDFVQRGHMGIRADASVVRHVSKLVRFGWVRLSKSGVYYITAAGREVREGREWRTI